jgi:protein-S-isoprenylcysteine O-methyltransferase Ste14
MNAQPQAPAARHSDPVVFPPVIPLTGFVLGLLVELVWPSAAWLTGTLRAGLRGVGGVLFGIGVAGFAWMVATMKAGRTPIHTARTPTALIESGPFRLSRNPMYLCGSIAYAGLALLFLKLWPLAFLPFVVAATHYGVILREEAFLANHFGAAYSQYQARVRRWW